jgi:methyl-accepting chemotaxis protein
MSPEAEVFRFRAKSILVLVLVCSLGAIATQFYRGIYIDRDLGFILSHMGGFLVMLPTVAIASSIWLYLTLRPLCRALTAISTGSPISDSERLAARSVMDKVSTVTVAVVVASFVLGPAISLAGAARAAGPGVITPAYVGVVLASNFAVGFACGVQIIILMASILSEPIASLEIIGLAKGARKAAISGRILAAGTAATLLAATLLGLAGYGALNAKEPIEAGRFALEALALVAVITLWAVSMFKSVGAFVAKRSSEVALQLRRVAEGESDLSFRLHIVHNDELSDISTAFNGFLARLSGLTGRVHELSLSVKDGADKLREAADHAGEAVTGLEGSVESARGAVQRQTETVSDTEGDIAKLLESIGQVASKVVEQASFMDQSSAAVSEMAANIASVSRVAEKADELATALQKASEDGGGALQASILSIGEIEEASRSVRDIIGVISKISAQTNLLAMNAAIEAAHAGDAGRGFAVVADEVRSLAESSAKSAKEIQLLIKGMTEKTTRGASLADSAGKAFDRITEGVAQTSELVRTIAASMSEQKEGAEEILRSTQSLSDATRLIEDLTEGQRKQSKEMEEAMLRIVATSNEIFEAVQEETGSSQALGRVVSVVSEEAGLNRERVIGLEEAISRFKTTGESR